MTVSKDPNDKYSEYAVDFHGIKDHSEDEIDPNAGNIDDWHNRHQDKTLENFCDSHPSAPQCKVFDE